MSWPYFLRFNQVALQIIFKWIKPVLTNIAKKQSSHIGICTAHKAIGEPRYQQYFPCYIFDNLKAMWNCESHISAIKGVEPINIGCFSGVLCFVVDVCTILKLHYTPSYTSLTILSPARVLTRQDVLCLLHYVSPYMVRSLFVISKKCQSNDTIDYYLLLDRIVVLKVWSVKLLAMFILISGGASDIPSLDLVSSAADISRNNLLQLW